MHGVKRTRQSPEAIQARKQRERAKIDEHRALAAQVLSLKAANDWGADALALTTRLLATNPEFYTVWNYRRYILLRGVFPASSPAQVNTLLNDDLAMTTSALRQHPKVYWIWNHRRWCLENIPDGPGDGAEKLAWKRASWARELYVVEKMLDADPRNFLAWDYRRYVLASSPDRRPESTELDYTTRKIESNFSNFSAWHQRSKVLASLWAKGEHTGVAVKDAEFEFIKQAMYVDPYDQSAWLYHRWLVGAGEDREVLEREIAVIEELREVEPDSKWCLDSLVHYKRLLIKHDPENAEALGKECLGMLSELERIDTFRGQRYRDLAAGIREG
ncbi:hypothetical protein BOTBODRAFT_498629 [Botryobasidium botryosum FD-172 SS1]|uniref:Geranylgeranyl transferase type-2 subunit alpha n=1 Tax=Botryobasidium botryosum (strain FD-172 SS1) TaxID=930990 RepID=A0A067ME33_BOTB1|nr:hypothetical protein BOTBODRAFT_498629 [Botryobasidium botryosum FD-172 SS1]